MLCSLVGAEIETQRHVSFPWSTRAHFLDSRRFLAVEAALLVLAHGIVVRTVQPGCEVVAVQAGNQIGSAGQ